MRLWWKCFYYLPWTRFCPATLRRWNCKILAILSTKKFGLLLFLALVLKELLSHWSSTSMTRLKEWCFTSGTMLLYPFRKLTLFTFLLLFLLLFLYCLRMGCFFTFFDSDASGNRSSFVNDWGITTSSTSLSVSTNGDSFDEFLATSSPFWWGLFRQRNHLRNRPTIVSINATSRVLHVHNFGGPLYHLMENPCSDPEINAFDIELQMEENLRIPFPRGLSRQE